MIQLCLTNIFKFYLLPNIMKFIYNITIITRSIFMILQYITHLPISNQFIIVSDQYRYADSVCYVSTFDQV